VTPAYLVFSSVSPARLDVPAWDGQAQRFFGTRLELVGEAGPEGRGRVRVVPANEQAGERGIELRPREPADLVLAEEGEARAGGGGLALLARRCHAVWVVTREAEKDRLALRLAMIVASVALGPILDARGPELFGVKTARGKLG
jgi:hypothetical protein